MYSLINEKINVSVVFKEQTMIPVQFEWNNKIHKIKAVDFKYNVKKGDTELVYFCVSNTTESYKIVLNKRNMTWKLEEIYSQKQFKHVKYLNEKANIAYRF